MRIIENKRKRGRDSTPSDWDRMDRLEQQIYLIVEQWKLAHGRYEQNYKRFLRYWNKKGTIRSLRRMDRTLKNLAPWVTTHGEFVNDPSGIVRRIKQFSPLMPFDEKMSKIKVEVKDGELWSISDPQYRPMTMIQLYTQFGTGWIADQLESLFKGGRIPKQMIGACANDLASLFQKETGRPQWNRVAEVVTANFSGVLPPDDGGRNLKLWVYNLVKRFRKRKQNRKEMTEGFISSKRAAE